MVAWLEVGLYLLYVQVVFSPLHLQGHCHGLGLFTSNELLVTYLLPAVFGTSTLSPLSLANSFENMEVEVGYSGESTERELMGAGF